MKNKFFNTRSGKAAILMIVAILALSACSKKADQLIVSGTIESTQIAVNTEVPGKVTAVDKEEGSHVQKGDILVTIDASNQELTVKQQEALVKSKLAKLDELKAGTRSEQINQAEAGVDTSSSSLNAAQTSVDNAKINYDYWVEKYNKTNSLFASGATSENELNDAKYKMDTANQQLLTSQRQLNTTQAQLNSSRSQLQLLRNGSTGQAIRAAEADLEQSQAALEQAKLLLSKYKIKAPLSGTYLYKNVNVGDTANTGASIGTLSDLTDQWVKIYVPQRNIHAITLNQDLDLKTVSLPGQVIKGKIVFIAGEAEFTPKNTETTEAKENTVFKVKIKILDHLEALKPGMTLETAIPLIH